MSWQKFINSWDCNLKSLISSIFSEGLTKTPPEGTIDKSLEQSNSKFAETRPNFKDDSTKNIGNGWTDDKLELLPKFWDYGLSISKNWGASEPK